MAHLTRALYARDPFHALEAASAYAKASGTSAAAEKRRALARQIEAAA